MNETQCVESVPESGLRPRPYPSFHSFPLSTDDTFPAPFPRSVRELRCRSDHPSLNKSGVKRGGHLTYSRSREERGQDPEILDERVGRLVKRIGSPNDSLDRVSRKNFRSIHDPSNPTLFVRFILCLFLDRRRIFVPSSRTHQYGNCYTLNLVTRGGLSLYIL